MEKTLYWLWLTNKQGLSYKGMRDLIEYFGSVDAVYKAESYDELNLNENVRAALKNKHLDKAKTIYDETVRSGGYILTIDDAEYPPMLRTISDPPNVLYCKGLHFDWKNILTIGVVGTRRYTSYGKRAAERICAGLARGGAVVVSGMARGIDSISAWSALRSGGKTVAVLGSGLDVIYPAENADLYDLIIENGVIITEYPPHTKPLGYNFPRRNRIIAGISYGVLVVQAPEKSGALITAGSALDSGRDVFSVPASIFDPESAGTNRLIQQGAKAVFDGSDIIEEYPYFELPDDEIDHDADERTEAVQDSVYESSKKTFRPDEKKARRYNAGRKRVLIEDRIKELKGKELEIVRYLERGPLHLDEICRRTDRDVNEINSIMVMLEITGYVIKLENNMFELNEDITQFI